MNEDERCSRPFFLIVNSHTIDVGEVAVIRMGDAGANFIKGNVGGTRKPKDGKRNRGDHNQRQQDLEKPFHR